MRCTCKIRFVIYNSVLFFVYLERCRETFHRAPNPYGLRVFPIPELKEVEVGEEEIINYHAVI